MILDQGLAREVVEALLSRGGEMADLFFQDEAFSFLQAEEGRLDRVTAGRDRGAGLRLVREGVTHFGSTVDVSPPGLLSLAKDLAAGTGEGGAETAIPSPARKPSDIGSRLATSALEEVEEDGILPLEEKARLVLAATRKARGADRRIAQARAACRDSLTRVLIANSRGALAEGIRSQAVFFVQVVAADGGRLETGYEPEGAPGAVSFLRRLDPERTAETAVRRALTALTAPEAPAGRMPVVLSSEAGGTMVHEAVGHGLEADLAGKGLSVYSGRMGERVASPLITVVDDPTLPGRRGSYAFDDEGTPAARTVLLEGGMLRAYLNDLAGAERTGQAPNGHGRRQSFRHWPIPRMGNTLILPGEDDPEEILRSVERGLLVRKMGGGQVNPVSGDFVFEVSEGYLIEKGRLSHPVRGATIAGNGPEVLASVDRVGSDLGFGIGTCGKEGQALPVSDAQPTLRIPEIAVGGRDSTGG